MSKEIKSPDMGFRKVSFIMTWKLFKKVRRSAITLDCSIGDLIGEFVNLNIMNFLNKKLLKKEQEDNKSVSPQA